MASTDMVKILAINNPITRKQFETEIDSGQTIAMAFPDLSEQVQAVINGRPVPKEEYSDCLLRGEDDIVFVRVPAGGDGGGKNVLRTAAFLAVTIAASAVSGGAFGLIAGSALLTTGVAAAGSLGASLLINTLIPPPSLSQSSDTSAFNRRGALTGASNQLAPYAPVPRVYGHMRVYPTMAAKPYTEVVGNVQYLHLLLNLGEGPLELLNPKIGDTAIGSFDSNNVFTSNDTYESVEIDVAENPRHYTNDINEVSPGVALDLKDDEMVRTTSTETDSFSLDVTFPRGLFGVDKDGNIESRTVDYDVYYRKTGDSSWTLIQQADNVRFGDFKATSDAKETYRCGLKYDFPSKDQYDVKIVRNSYGDPIRFDSATEPTQRPNGDALQYLDIWNKTGNEYLYIPAEKLGDFSPLNVQAGWNDLEDIHIYLRSTTSIVTAFRSITNQETTNLPGTVQIGMRIKATDQLNGVLDSFNVEAKSILSYYDGGWSHPEMNPDTGANKSTAGGKVTSEPAWIVADIYCGDQNKEAIPYDRLDGQAFKDWADAYGSIFEYNAVIDSISTVDQLATNVAAAGKASIGNPEGKYIPVLDEANQTAVQMFNPRNSSDFSISGKPVEELHGLKVRFNDETNGWKQTERIVYNDNYSEDGTPFDGGFGACDINDPDAPNCKEATKFTDITFDGVTDPEQVWRLARYKLAERTLRPATYTYKTDIEHLVAKRGDVVYQASDVVLWGSSFGRLKAVGVDGQGKVNSLTLDETVLIQSANDYNIRIRRQDGSFTTFEVTNSAGDANVLSVTPQSADINKGDLFHFGIAGEEDVRLKVAGIKPGPNLSATLTLVDEAPGIQEADSGTIPAYNPNITLPVEFEDTTPPAPVIDSVRSDDSTLYKDEDGTFRLRMLVSFSVSPGNQTTEIEARYRAVNSKEGWIGIFKADANLGVVSLPDVARGKDYVVQIRSRYKNNVSEWVQYSTAHTVEGKQYLPPDVSGFTAAIDKTLIRLSWNPVNISDLSEYEVRTEDGNWGTENQHYIDSSRRLMMTDQITTAGTITYYIKAIDTSGNYSAHSAIAQVTIGNKYTGPVAFDSDLQDYVQQTIYDQDITALQQQVDGQIESHFYGHVPTLSNLPASDWTTNDEKDKHLGDLFYNNNTGYAYRFAYSGGSYQWIRVVNDDIAKALSDASDAQDTADSKRRTFLVQPTPPYDEGDLWVKDVGSEDEIYKCTNAKTGSQSFSQSDWALIGGTKPAQDKADAAKQEAKTYADGLVDGKIESFYQNAQPTSATEGDLWFDTNNDNKAYYYNGSSWVSAQDGGIADAINDAATAQATADGKITSFVQGSEPTAEGIGDLWYNINTGQLYRWNGSNWNENVSDVTEDQFTKSLSEIESQKESARNDLAAKLGYTSYSAMVAAQDDIIDVNGLLNANIISADAILTQQAAITGGLSVGQNSNVLIDPTATIPSLTTADRIMNLSGTDHTGTSTHSYSYFTGGKALSDDSYPVIVDAQLDISQVNTGVNDYMVVSMLVEGSTDGGSSWDLIEKSIDSTTVIDNNANVSLEIDNKVYNVFGFTHIRIGFQVDDPFAAGSLNYDFYNIDFQQYTSKVVINDKNIFAAISPTIVRSLASSGGTFIGGGGSMIADWDSLLNKPFDSLSSDFTVSGGVASLADTYYKQGSSASFNSLSITTTDKYALNFKEGSIGNLTNIWWFQPKNGSQLRFGGTSSSDTYDMLFNRITGFEVNTVIDAEGFISTNNEGSWFDAVVSNNSDSGIFKGLDSNNNAVGRIVSRNFNGTGGGYLDLDGSWKLNSNDIWTDGNLPNPVQTGDSPTFNNGTFDGPLSANTLRTDTGKLLSPSSYQFRNAGDTGYRDVYIQELHASGNNTVFPHMNIKHDYSGETWFQPDNGSRVRFGGSGSGDVSQYVFYRFDEFRIIGIPSGDDVSIENVGLNVEGEVSASSIYTDTLRARLFSYDQVTVRGLYDVIGRGGTIVSVSGSTITLDNESVQNSKTVRISTPNASVDGFTNINVHIASKSGNTYTLSGFPSGFTIADIHEGMAVTQIEGDQIISTIDSGIPQIAGYDDVQDWTHSPLNPSGTVTASWKLNQTEFWIGGSGSYKGGGVYMNAPNEQFSIGTNTLWFQGGDGHLGNLDIDGILDMKTGGHIRLGSTASLADISGERFNTYGSYKINVAVAPGSSGLSNPESRIYGDDNYNIRLEGIYDDVSGTRHYYTGVNINGYVGTDAPMEDAVISGSTLYIYSSFSSVFTNTTVNINNIIMNNKTPRVGDRIYIAITGTGQLNYGGSSGNIQERAGGGRMAQSGRSVTMFMLIDNGSTNDWFKFMDSGD